MLLSVTILLLLIAASGANGEGDAVILVIVVLIGLLGLEVLLLKVPQPKMPKGISVANGRYVITDPRVHPGFSRVLVGRSCIFRDERLVRVKPYL